MIPIRIRISQNVFNQHNDLMGDRMPYHLGDRGLQYRSAVSKLDDIVCDGGIS